MHENKSGCFVFEHSVLLLVQLHCDKSAQTWCFMCRVKDHRTIIDFVSGTVDCHFLLLLYGARCLHPCIVCCGMASGDDILRKRKICVQYGRMRTADKTPGGIRSAVI